MQAVILAAGRGTRMKELTDEIPKPMIVINGKTLLEHKFDAFPKEIDEIILVIGYYGEKIQAAFGEELKGRKITYVTQTELNGTGGALWATKDLLKDKFIVLNGDDLYVEKDLEKCIRHEWAILVLAVSELGSAANVTVNEAGDIQEIIEKEKHSGGPGRANAGAYMLDRRVFDYPLVKRPKSEEYGLPQTIVQAAPDISIKAVEATSILMMTGPEDVEKAPEWLQTYSVEEK